MKYPKPEIGFYYAECCLLDLYRIEDQYELDSILEDIEDPDRFGDLMVFPTLIDAVRHLADTLPVEERSAQFERLGLPREQWVLE